MNDVNLVHTVFQINLEETIVSLVVIATTVIALKLLIEKLFAAFNKEPWWIKKRREHNEYLRRLDTLEKQREEDVKQSNMRDKRIKDSVDALNQNMTLVSNKLDLMDEESKQNKLAELKDKIGQSYRYYHEKQEWNSMEEETLRDLITRYEANGGENSFVHSVVLPESYIWRKVN